MTNAKQYLAFRDELRVCELGSWQAHHFRADSLGAALRSIRESDNAKTVVMR